MSTLVRMTELRQVIENCILESKKICISISNSFISCMNKINIENYEVKDDYLYLADDNFEVHINFEDTTSITYNDFENCYTIMNNDMEISLYFI